jgi:O-acetyl-ADP-ribose deacetylase
MSGKLEIVQGDITREDTDAIVNAANGSLLGGGGVDGAIHAAAGPGLLAECRALNGCETGEAKITQGHNLRARWVIHTVGPVWHGGQHSEPELLASCYRRSLELTERYPIKSVAFPSISTGIYGYPVELAAPIAVREVRSYLASHEHLDLVRLVCYSDEAYEVYLKALAQAEQSAGTVDQG